MIISPLKSSAPFAIIILIITSILLWIGSFFFAATDLTPTEGSTANLYEPFFSKDLPYFFRSFLCLVAFLIGAFLTNFLSINQEISSKSNYLSGFFYIILAFSCINDTGSHFILVSNICLILCMYLLVKTYKRDHVFSTLFMCGLCLGIACFFYIQYIFVFPVVIISLFILRPFNWREWLIMLLGFFAPFYIYESICYLSNNDMSALFTAIENTFENQYTPIVSKYDLQFFISIILLTAMALISGLSKGFGVKVKTQKIKYILIWLLALCIPTIFFNQDPEMILFPFIFPLSILMGDYMSELKRVRVANILLTLFMASFLVLYCYKLGFLH